MASRPDERHLASENIEELRKFVDVRPAQKGTDPCHPRIAVHSLDRRPVVAGFCTHRAKLYDPEDRAAPPPTPLEKQGGAWALEADQKSDEKQKREKKKKKKSEKVKSIARLTIGYAPVPVRTTVFPGKRCLPRAAFFSRLPA